MKLSLDGYIAAPGDDARLVWHVGRYCDRY